MQTLYRSGAEIEVRSDGTGRTIYGIAVPFNQETVVNDGFGSYRELFRHGSFTRTIAERGDRVKLLANHDRRRFPIGRPTLLREDPAGLYVEAKISQTRDGDEALELVRDGALDGLSVGFRPVHPGPHERPGRGGLIERIEVALSEVSLTGFAAYPGAMLAGVRSMLADLDDTEREALYEELAAAHQIADAAHEGTPDPADVAAHEGTSSPLRSAFLRSLTLRGVT